MRIWTWIWKLIGSIRSFWESLVGGRDPGKMTTKPFPNKDRTRVGNWKKSQFNDTAVLTLLQWFVEKQITEVGVGTDKYCQAIHSWVLISTLRFQQPPAEAKVGDHCSGQLCRSSHTVTTQVQQQNKEMETMYVSVGVGQTLLTTEEEKHTMWEVTDCPQLIWVLIFFLPVNV